MTDREKLIGLIGNTYAAVIADHLIAHGVTVREPGRWISDEGDVLFHCSECDTQISTSWDYDDLHWNFCPNCGARMDGERRSDG